MENFLTSNGLAAAFNLYGTVMMVALAVSLGRRRVLNRMKHPTKQESHNTSA